MEPITHCLTSCLLTAPLDLTTTADDFLHPQPNPGRYTCGERYKAFQRPTKHLPNYDNGDEDGHAEATSSLLEGREHRFIADRWCRVEKYVGLFAMYGNVRRATLSDRVGRCSDILLLLVFRVGLRGLCLYSLRGDVSGRSSSH